MNALIQKFGEAMQTSWRDTTALQRLGLLMLISGIVFMIGWTVNTAPIEERRLLIGADEPADRSKQVADTLTKVNIPFERVGEVAIYVKPEDYGKATLELAGEGIFTDRETFKWLDEIDTSPTRWVNDKKCQVAVQRKLESTIQQMSAIHRASVLITLADPSQIPCWAPRRPTAMVNVKPKAGMTITPKIATAIASIVSKTVPSLKREDVAVIDDTTSQLIPVEVELKHRPTPD